MKISIIGAGNMGGAIATGAVCSGLLSPDNVTISNPSVDKLNHLKNTLGVNVTTDNIAAVKNSDLVIIAVKPWLLEQVLLEIKETLDYEHQMLASVVAGVDFARLEAILQREGSSMLPLFRVIPNTAISIQQSVTFIAAHKASEQQTTQLLELFGKMGEALLVDESMMVAGTSLASCGIAFALKYLDASIQGGEELGFDIKDARRIVLNTMKGALGLMEHNNTMPKAEIDKVTTPGGITLKGLDAMEQNNFTQAVIAGLRKSR